MPATKERPAVAALSHRGGCPAERVETYRSDAPGGTKVQITRCIDCGAQTTKE